MLEHLEFMKKWAMQNHDGLSAQGIADAVVRMCDDGIRLIRDAEQRNGAEAGGSGLSSVSKPNLGEPCPHCKGKATINRKWYATTCGYCRGWGRVILNK